MRGGRQEGAVALVRSTWYGQTGLSERRAGRRGEELGEHFNNPSERHFCIEEDRQVTRTCCRAQGNLLSIL